MIVLTPLKPLPINDEHFANTYCITNAEYEYPYDFYKPAKRGSRKRVRLVKSHKMGERCTWLVIAENVKKARVYVCC